MNLLKKYIPVYWLVTSSSWLSRVIVGSAQLVGARLILSNLDSKQFALFALLTNLAGWFTQADMGVGTSLQNYVSEKRAGGLPYGPYVIASGILAIFFLGGLVAVFKFVSPWIAPWFLSQYTFLQPLQKTHYFFTVCALFIVTNIGGIAWKLWFAEQRGYWGNLVAAVAAVLGNLGVWLVLHYKLPNLLYWIFIAYLGPAVFIAIIQFLLVMWQHASVWRQVDREIVGSVLARSGHFAALGLMTACVMQMDYLAISQLLAPHSVAIYAIVSKLYVLIFFFYSALLNALWPVCAEAISQHQWPLVHRLIKRNLLVGLAIVGGATLALVYGMPQVIALLSPKTPIRVPVSVIFLAGLFYLVRTWSETFAMILMSMNSFRVLWTFIPLQILAGFAFLWILTRHLGIPGVFLGLTCCYLLTVCWGYPLAVQRLARKDMRGAAATPERSPLLRH